MKKMKSIIVIGRLWFNKRTGNTYHSAQIVVDGDVFARIPYAYGYGDQFLWTAFEWLQEHSYLKLDGATPWNWAKDNGVKLFYTSANVRGKEDL